MSEESGQKTPLQGGSDPAGRARLRQSVLQLSPSRRRLLELRLAKSASRPGDTRPIAQRTAAAVLPLSASQQRLWLLHQLAPNSGLYNVYHTVKLLGPLQPEVLGKALDALLERHEILRTSYAQDNGAPFQRVHPFEPGQGERLLTPATCREGERAALDILRQEMTQPFDLTKQPQLRAHLLRLATDQHLLLLAMPHIACDGWSLQIVLHDLATLYRAASHGERASLPPLEIQFADYALWQRQQMDGSAAQEALSYWRRQLDHIATLQLPADRPRPANRSPQGEVVEFVIPAALAARAKALAYDNGASLFMLLLAVFKVLLYRLSGETDIAVGTPVAGRGRTELERLVGCFVNTLVIRTDLAGEPVFSRLMEQVRDTTLAALEHQDLPFEHLVDALNPKRDSGGNPFFDVMFVLHNQPMTAFRSAEIELQTVPLRPPRAKFDLTLEFTEGQEGVAGVLEYATDLFERSTAERISKQYLRLLTGLTSRPGVSIDTVSMLDATERETLLFDWNDTFTNADPPQPVELLFERQADLTPLAPALRWQDRTLTYRELNARANRLAHMLSRRHCGAGDLVALFLERTPDLVAAVLGVLKSGAAYLPLDPAQPSSRLELMLSDANPAVLLSTQNLAGDLPALGRTDTLCLDALDSELQRYPATNPSRAADTDSAAYVLYTSGSTGRPKGTVVSTRGLANYCGWAADSYEFGRGSGTLLYSSIGFDLTITSLLPPLISGATVHLLSTNGVDALLEELSQLPRLGVLKITPAHLQLLAHRLTPAQARALTHTLVIGGDTLHGEQLEFWLKHAPDTRLINEYGPTETVVGCCVHEVTHENHSPDPVPIGRPIRNTRLYVLGPAMQPVPVGVVGELYIGGDGVAHGYLNRPELTRSRFVENPYSDTPGARLYRSGDLARYRPDGTLEYHGRIDHQIKLRGYRIEPQEIESVLLDHPAVREACVTALSREGTTSGLTAWVTLERTSAATASEIQTFSALHLPAYMVPTKIQVLESMPLNKNGKIDRVELTDTAHQARASTADDIPVDAVQGGLMQIWRNTLGVERVGLDESFFDLGGHSLLGTQMLVDTENRFGVHLPLAVLFKAPTVRKLARVVRGGGWATEWNSLIAIQTAGVRPPFFSIHGDPSRLLPHLRPDQPYYWLHRGQDGSLLRYASIEDVAADHLREILAVQPHGPYCLGGYSFGGLLALEAAKSLRARGETVLVLALFDPPAPPPATERLARPLRATLAQALSMLPKMLVWLPLEARRRVRRGLLRIAEQLHLAAGKPLPNRLRYARHGRLYSRAVRAYVHGHYDGDTLLFAPKLPKRELESLAARWRTVVRGNLEIHSVPTASRHSDLFEEPSMSYVAQQLNRSLDGDPPNDGESAIPLLDCLRSSEPQPSAEPPAGRFDRVG